MTLKMPDRRVLPEDIPEVITVNTQRAGTNEIWMVRVILDEDKWPSDAPSIMQAHYQTFVANERNKEGPTNRTDELSERVKLFVKKFGYGPTHIIIHKGYVYVGPVR